MGRLNWMVLGISCGLSGMAGAQSMINVIGQDYYEKNPVYIGESMSYSSPPPRAYVSTSPQPFVVVSGQHNFYDSRLPSVGDVKPQVLIRTYNPELGVYTDTVIRDPRKREVVSD